MEHRVIRNYFIPEPDLALLERCVPLLHEVCSSMPAAYMRPDVQVAIEESKRVLSDVRWGYGPFQSVEIVRGNREDTPDAAR